MDLDLKLVDLSESLKTYLDRDALTLSNLADAYLELSRTIYKILAKYPKSWSKLKKRYPILLKLMDNIQQKKTIYSGDEKKDLQDKNSVWTNNDRTLKNIDFYVTIMQRLGENKFKWIFSLSAIAISIVSIILSLVL